jgi:hypothetical protein
MPTSSPKLETVRLKIVCPHPTAVLAAKLMLSAKVVVFIDAPSKNLPGGTPISLAILSSVGMPA